MDQQNYQHLYTLYKMYTEIIGRRHVRFPHDTHTHVENDVPIIIFTFPVGHTNISHLLPCLRIAEATLGWQTANVLGVVLW